LGRSFNPSFALIFEETLLLAKRLFFLLNVSEALQKLKQKSEAWAPMTQSKALAFLLHHGHHFFIPLLLKSDKFLPHT